MAAQPYVTGKISRRGPKREQNEDHVGIPPDWIEPAVLEAKGHLVMVADGMGGHQAGQDASRRAVSRIFHEYYADPSPDIPHSLEQAIAMANAEVYQAAQQNPAFQGMGTTVTAAVVHGNELYVANVGDSRTYLVRGGVAHQLTKDHSFVQEQVDAGTLTLDQARISPYRNVITRSLGQRPQVQTDHFLYTLQPGDRVVLCSDGVSGVVDEQELARVVAMSPDPARAAEEVLNLAEQRGRSDDAAVVVVGRAGRAGAPAAAPAAARGAARGAARPPTSMAWLPLAGAGLALVAVVALAMRGFSARPSQATPTLTLASPTQVTTVTTAGDILPTSTLAGVPATSTALPAPSPTAVPAKTTRPPSTVLAPAPRLVSPRDGESWNSKFVGLSWIWAGTLATNNYYDVRVWKEGQPNYGIGWTQDAATPYSFRPGAGQGKYCWQIVVIRQTGANTDGTKIWEPISEESEVRCFEYTYSPPQPTPVHTEKPEDA